MLLHTTNHNQSTDEKNESILWKLSFIQMKILKAIACNLNWIELDWIQIHIRMEYEFNSI
jgi:hypothetical protein